MPHTLNAIDTRGTNAAVSRLDLRDRVLPASTQPGLVNGVLPFVYNLVSSIQIIMHCCACIGCSSSFSLPSGKAAISKNNCALSNLITHP